MDEKSGVGPLNDDVHKAKGVYSGSDIALGITIQTMIGERRTVTMQTHTMRDCDQKELNGILDKMMAASDRTGARYRLEELQLTREQHVKDLAQQMENFSQTNNRWQEEWINSKRRGPFALNGSQQSAKEQALTLQERVRREITKLDAEIGKVERQLASG